MASNSRTPGASGTRTVEIKIRRYQPQKTPKPYWQTFQVEVEANDRLLDALNRIKWEQDGTLTFRRSCAHGVCGSDAMRVNGRNRLACKLLMADVGQRVTVEAMLGYPVIRDLVVDMDPFFAKYEKIKPYLINGEPEPRTERLQSPDERARYDDSTKCILCGACTGSCPQVWANPRWVGPASIVNAHRFIFDSRDRAAAERLRILSDYDGVWPCKTIFNCTRRARAAFRSPTPSSRSSARSCMGRAKRCKASSHTVRAARPSSPSARPLLPDVPRRHECGSGLPGRTSIIPSRTRVS